MPCKARSTRGAHWRDTRIRRVGTWVGAAEARIGDCGRMWAGESWAGLRRTVATQRQFWNEKVADVLSAISYGRRLCRRKHTRRLQGCITAERCALKMTGMLEESHIVHGALTKGGD